MGARAPPNPATGRVCLDMKVLALTSVAFFMVALDALIVVTALPAIHNEIGGSLATLDWAVNAYLLVFAAGVITAAALGDRFGRRRLYTVGLVLFAAASAACALAPTAAALIAARAVQGAGAAIVTPLSLTILTTSYPAEGRGRIVGVWAGIAGLAAAGGPLVGGAVTQGLNWHWIFWLNVPVGLVAAVLSVRWLPESRGPATRLDLPGAVLVSVGAAALAGGLVRVSEPLLGLGILALVAFVVWETRTPHPMLPPRLFRIRSFAGAGTTAFLVIGASTSAAFLVSQYFQFALGYSPLGTGLRFLPWTAMPLLVAPVAGLLSDRIGPRPVMAAGMLLQGVGLAWIALIASTTTGYGPFVPALFVAGIGLSMALPTTAMASVSAVPPADMGKASGVNSTLQRFGGVFGVAVVSTVFAANGHLGDPATVTAGFRPALAVSAGLSLVGAVSALAVSRRPRRALRVFDDALERLEVG